MKKTLVLAASVLSCFLYSQETSPLIVDENYSAIMGATDIASTHAIMMKTEDLLLGRYNGTSESVGAGLVRLAELALFWGPVDSLGYVTQRTLFGAGYRKRELSNITSNRIKLMDDWPLYYDHDVLKATFKEQTPLSEVLDYTIAPTEATMVLADQLKLRFLYTKSVDGRQSLLYAFSALDLTANLYRSDEDLIGDPIESDFLLSEPESYIHYMDRLYPDAQINFENLKLKSLVNLLDPYLWYAIYSPLTYIVKGEAVETPMIPLFGGGGYLPGLRMALAPYGPEYYFMNYLRTGGGNPIMAYVKWGSLGGHQHWGAGINAPYLISYELGAVGIKADFFKQYHPKEIPTISSNDEGEGYEREKGFLATLIMNQAFQKGSHIRVTGQLGYKTKGYVPGESLKAGLIARAGIAITF